MEKITINEIIREVGGKLIIPQSFELPIIKGVSIDSRNIKPGDLFIAIKGSNTDGHLFVNEAQRKGAVCAIVSKRGSYQLPVIIVEDTVKALGDLAYWYRRRFSTPIVGITGSNGKTTTKEITAKCLSIRYEVCKSESSFNSLTGVPLSLFNLSPTHKVGVFEIGTNKIGEIKRLAEIVEPKFGVITNIGPAHLASFKTIEGVLNEKLELTRVADISILNADDPMLSQVQVKGAFWYGIKEGNIRATNITELNNGVRFKVNDVVFEVPLIGRYQIYNILAAISVGLHFELKLKDMSETLREISSLPQREEIIEVRDIRIIDSSYNANPASMELALQELAKHKGRRKVAILGDMLELGENAYDFHIAIGKLVKALGIDILIGYGELAKGYIKGSKLKEKFHFTDLEEFDIKKILKSGDTVLVKGSRGMGMEKIVEDLKENL